MSQVLSSSVPLHASAVCVSHYLSSLSLIARSAPRHSFHHPDVLPLALPVPAVTCDCTGPPGICESTHLLAILMHARDLKPRRAARQQAVFPLDSDAAEACATFMQLLRGPDALGTTVQEWRTTTGSALADMLQVRSAMCIQEKQCVTSHHAIKAYATHCAHATWCVMPAKECDGLEQQTAGRRQLPLTASQSPARHDQRWR